MMSLVSPESPFLQLKDHIAYSVEGVLSKIIWKSEVCQHTLFCMAGGTSISEHTSTRDATLHVIEGTGVLTLAGEKISLSPGIFVLISANVPHELEAAADLAFVLTLSKAS